MALRESATGAFQGEIANLHALETSGLSVFNNEFSGSVHHSLRPTLSDDLSARYRTRRVYLPSQSIDSPRMRTKKVSGRRPVKVGPIRCCSSFLLRTFHNLVTILVQGHQLCSTEEDVPSVIKIAVLPGFEGLSRGLDG